MRKNISTLAALALAAAASPVLADLQVTTDLGTYNTSATTVLSGTTVGMANNAFTYSTIAGTSTSLWGNGEYVYKFELTKPAFLYLSNSADPEADGTFPDPNNDYFLLNTLVTQNSNNTSTSSTGNPNWTGWATKPEATNLALVSNSVNSTTPGSSANAGIFRTTTTNPYGIYAAGTYYISVDSSSGSLNSYGQANQLPAGTFTADFHVKYLDDVSTPASKAAQLQTGSSISLPYTAGQANFFSFDYTGGGFRLDTEGNTLPGTDTVLVLYDSAGRVIKVNDEVGQNTTDPDSVGLPWSWSRLIIADGEIAAGRYYLGYTEYKAEANPGFDFRVHPSSVGGSGTFVINGLALSLVPGDADGDGDVDLDDQGIWAANFTGSLEPNTGTGTSATGDFDGDKDVDLDDQGIWASNFTGSLAPSGLTSVPEPSSLLAACGLALLPLTRRRQATR